MKRIVFLLFIAVALSSFACAEETSSVKGEEETFFPEMYPSKADLWFAPTEHFEDIFEEGGAGTFEEGFLFHAWDFTITDASTITLETTPEEGVDTVMYLYHRMEEDTSWGRYELRDPPLGADFTQVEGSYIMNTFEGGEYRVMVKAYRDTMRGSFFLMGACDGAGCPLTQTQQAN